MISGDIIRLVRRLQIRARRAVDSLLGGEYHSAFRGAGIAFEEVREYQPGDDVRTIDWNVTARLGHPFVKRFVEERELTVVLVVDVSGSLDFGTGRLTKREVVAELAAVVALSAAGNNDRIGLLLVSDRVELFLPPRKGSRHVLRVLREVLTFTPTHLGTSLQAGLDYLNRVQRRRAVVFVLSDFLDVDDRPMWRRTGQRHDLIAVRISDPREAEMPAVGLVEVEDAETGARLLIDTNRPAMRQQYAEAARRRHEQFLHQARAASVDVIDVSTDGDHLHELARFFRLREQRIRRS
jgi:uncharacterized protein (DUF58 family)